MSSNLKDSFKLFSILFLLTLLLLSVLEFPVSCILSNIDTIGCFHSGHSDGMLWCLMATLISISFITCDAELFIFIGHLDILLSEALI